MPAIKANVVIKIGRKRMRPAYISASSRSWPSSSGFANESRNALPSSVCWARDVALWFDFLKRSQNRFNLLLFDLEVALHVHEHNQTENRIFFATKPINMMMPMKLIQVGRATCNQQKPIPRSSSRAKDNMTAPGAVKEPNCAVRSDTSSLSPSPEQWSSR